MADTRPTLLYLGVLKGGGEGDRVQVLRKVPGMERYARLRNWRLVTVEEDRCRPSDLPALLARTAPVGCIVDVLRGSTALRPTLFGEIPLVYLDDERGSRESRIARVVPDTQAVVQAAFRELAETKPTRYAVVGYRNARVWSARRVTRFREIVVAAGGGQPLVFCRRAEDAAARLARLTRWVAGLPARCAVFAVNDDTAMEVIAAADRAGRRIPGDLAIVGVDNVELAAHGASVGCSSVEIDFERAGYCAASLIDELRRGRPPRVEMFGPLMTVRRESTRGHRPIGPAIRKALLRIRAEACNGLRARDVAAMIPGSRRLAELRFRECLGHSILNEIDNVRLNAVCELLRDAQVPLDEVFSRSGYASSAALRKAFRAKTGLSLLKWRKRHS